MKTFLRILCASIILVFSLPAETIDVKKTEVYARIKASLNAVPAIDTHSHLVGPERLQRILETEFRGPKPTDSALRRLWVSSYYTWEHPLPPWPEDGRFETWWTEAQIDFDNSRARSAYRAMLPIFWDLYGVDFESIGLEEAKRLNGRMEKNYEDPDWPAHVLSKRANIELMLIDSFILPQSIRDHFPFTVSACNIRWYINGFHPSEFSEWRKLPAEDPYAFAGQYQMPIGSLDDYVAVLERILVEAKKAGAVCLKSQIAYDRTLEIERVDKQEAAFAFGKSRGELTPSQIKRFQDYIFWRLAELSAKHELPFQIHTGHARIQGSNPMNLVDLITANPKTTFILFHGGFPWVGESGMIALKYPNVYLDSVWLPTLSYTMGKRAFKEWLDMIASNRIMWGSDMFTVEGSYGTVVFARRCIAEVLAEKVVADELREADALRIGRQILRENALEAIPLLRGRIQTGGGR